MQCWQDIRKFLLKASFILLCFLASTVDLDASRSNVQITYTGNGELDVSAGNLKRYYTRDHLGSVRNVMDASGNEIASYDYSPFGIRETLSGSYEAEMGYTRHHYHAESGLVLALYRAYDPITGRWLSLDSLGEAGGINLYRYSLNSPINLWDPNGLSPRPSAKKFWTAYSKVRFVKINTQQVFDFIGGNFGE